MSENENGIDRVEGGDTGGESGLSRKIFWTIGLGGLQSE